MSKNIDYCQTVPRWGVFEAVLEGPSDGNPFVDQHVTATFSNENERKQVEGFYDGDGTYRVRFMPSFSGSYTFSVETSFWDSPQEGKFAAGEPEEGNHGPVRVADTFHFAYEDGTPYYPIGTTCYVWELQKEELQKKTLETLANSPFNKIRFCIFPKHYVYNFHEPIAYPYEGTPVDNSGITKENFKEYERDFSGNHWDFTRFNPAYFRHIEQSIGQLGDLGIEADLIVMHPYDRWGFSQMSPSEDDLYWHYVVARFAAYRNVWWSLANEYDLLKTKTTADWERYASILVGFDPYRHLRSIHNCKSFYDYSRPWVTHCSIQRTDPYRTTENTDIWREQYRKPVVLDEIVYEGNIPLGWGNISGQELTRRFWEAVCRGGYPGHGETYVDPDDLLWWSHGGTLKGESPKRIAFLRKILEEAPGHGLAPLHRTWDEVCAVPEDLPDFFSGSHPYYLIYFGFNRPSSRTFHFDDTTRYAVEVIDTWEMTVKQAGTHKGRFTVELPGKEYMALRLTKVG